MATDATFDNQLQALATATANFANGKDAQIKNTIITALGGSTQQGGGAATLTLGNVVEVNRAYWDEAVAQLFSDETGNYIQLFLTDYDSDDKDAIQASDSFKIYYTLG